MAFIVSSTRRFFGTDNAPAEQALMSGARL